MKLVEEKGIQEIKIYNSRRPKFSGRGRTWDSLTCIYVGDEKVEMFCDTTWGWKAYFCLRGKWYNMDVFLEQDIKEGSVWILKRG